MHLANVTWLDFTLRGWDVKLTGASPTNCTNEKTRREAGFQESESEGLNRVRRRGLEPPRELPHQHLKLARLPFRHLRVVLTVLTRKTNHLSELKPE